MVHPISLLFTTGSLASKNEFLETGKSITRISLLFTTGSPASKNEFLGTDKGITRPWMRIFRGESVTRPYKQQFKLWEAETNTCP